MGVLAKQEDLKTLSLQSPQNKGLDGPLPGRVRSMSPSHTRSCRSPVSFLFLNKRRHQSSPDT